jgi:hypothetical protein
MLHLWKGVINSHMLGWVSLRVCVDMVLTGDLFQPGDDHLQPDIGFLSSKKVSPLLDMKEGVAVQKNGSVHSRYGNSKRTVKLQLTWQLNF